MIGGYISEKVAAAITRSISGQGHLRLRPRMRTLLGNRSVVDHQHGIAAADEPVRLHKQFCLHRGRIPDRGGNEVVQLIIFAKRSRSAIGECFTRQGRSAPIRRADTFIAALYDPTDPETA